MRFGRVKARLRSGLAPGGKPELNECQPYLIEAKQLLSHASTTFGSTNRATARGALGLVIASGAVWTLAISPLIAADEPRPAAPRAIVTPKLLRYAERVVRQYDVNADGQLSAEEWKAMRGDPAAADLNRDGQITVAEFAQHVADFGAGRAIRLSISAGGALAQAEPAGEPAAEPSAQPGSEPAPPAIDPRRRLKYFAASPAGVPGWFIERDADGDSQLTLAEFSPKLLKNEITDFNRLDLNHDGLLTPQEFLRADKIRKPDAAAGEAAARP